jgi:hypothetical protein
MLRWSCSPYVACRTTAHTEVPITGVVAWRVGRAGGHPRFSGRSAVEDGRARFRTPRLDRPGKYVARGIFDSCHFVSSDNTATFRVVR